MNSKKSFTYLRIAFGIVWAIDAAMKWQPAFLNNFTEYLTDAAQGAPTFCAAWINIWIRIVSVDPHAFALGVAVIETAIALCLIFGVFTRITLWVGIFFSVLIWSTAECFGGPYMAGCTDIGCAIIYVFVFLALLFGLSKHSETEENISHIPENKKDTYIKILILAVAILFAALIAPYLVNNTVAQSADLMSGDMMQKTFNIPAGDPIPTVSFTLTKNSLDGYDLHVTTTNFTFTPQNIGKAPVADEGHVHLYIDGVLFVVLSDWYHVDSSHLPPGKHVIVVSLNANDHSIFWANGKNIQATQTVNTY